MLDAIKTYHDVISSPEYNALNAVEQIEVIADIIKGLSSVKTALIKRTLKRGHNKPVPLLSINRHMVF